MQQKFETLKSAALHILKKTQLSRQADRVSRHTRQKLVSNCFRKNVCSLSKTVWIKATQAKNCTEFIEHSAKPEEVESAKRVHHHCTPTQTHTHPNVTVELTVKNIQHFSIFTDSLHSSCPASLSIRTPIAAHKLFLAHPHTRVLLLCKVKNMNLIECILIIFVRPIFPNIYIFVGSAAQLSSTASSCFSWRQMHTYTPTYVVLPCGSKLAIVAQIAALLGVRLVHWATFWWDAHNKSHFI